MRCRGLTAVVRERYYPDYRFVASGTCVPKTGRDGGMSRGRRVDAEVERWIRSRLETDPVLARARESRPFSARRIVARARTAKERRHPFSRAFIALMNRLGLRPVGAQVVVRDEQCDLATLVDGVFVDSGGRVVLVELKCGFEGYVDASTGFLGPPFQKFTNAPKNQHQLQLAFTRCMFEKTFPEFGGVDARIVRMTERGAHVSTVDADIDRTVRRVLATGKRV